MVAGSKANSGTLVGGNDMMGGRSVIRDVSAEGLEKRIGNTGVEVHVVLGKELIEIGRVQECANCFGHGLLGLRGLGLIWLDGGLKMMKGV